MKISVSTKVTAGVATVIIALLVSTILSFQARHHQTESRTLVLHTYQVLNQLERIHSVMKDAETGQRGYLLTGDTGYLEPHRRASDSVDQLIDQLKNLTKDNPTQQVRLGALSLKTDELLAAQNKTIELRRQRSLDAAADAAHFVHGKERMEEIRRIIEEMIDTENVLLKERSVLLDNNTTRSFALATWFSAASMVCLIVAGWLLLRFLAARQRAEQELSIQYSIVRILNEAQTFAEAARSVEQLIAESGNWCIGSTWVMDATDNVLKCLDVWQLAALADSDFVKLTASIKFKPGEGLPGRVWSTGKATSLDDVKNDENFPRARQAREIGLTAGFAFPITFGGKTIAVTEFFSKDRRVVDQALLDMMTALGNQLGQFMTRKSVEEETVRQRHFLRLILDTVSDGIVVADSNGNFILTNAAAEELNGKKTGIPPQEWAEQYGVFVEKDGEHFPAESMPLVLAMNGENVDDVELYIRNQQVPDGRWISVSGRPLKEKDESISGGVVFFRDISDKKEAEQRVSEFYSTVSHELRTPLTSIRGSLGLIEGGLAGALPEKTMKLIKIARVESDRLIRLINDILDLRKIEAGMLELRKTTVETRSIVERTRDGISGMADERGVQLVIRLNTGGPTQCDEDRLIQVLTNLISNAIKYSESDNEVIVSLDPGQGNSFKFSVIDHGPGIPQEQMHKLFGKFQQIDQSDSRRREGTGLGLAITQAIVKEHGGTIGVDSEPGKGSTFWFELPAVFSPVLSDGGKKMPAAHVRPALIIEDDESVSEILATHLARDGFEVIQAKSLAEAHELLQKYKPIVILLDLGLPDGNGLDLLQKLNSDAQQREIPVVIITGSDKDGKPTYGHPALIDWISKPFDETRLHKALDTARQHIGLARVLVIEDDPSTREILKQQLESIGVSCIEAANGTQALDQFSASAPDLVILDLMIPPPDGFAVVDKLRDHPHGMKPLVVYTALDLTEEEKSRLTLGITAHLTKATATPDQLSGIVRHFLDGLLLHKPKDSDDAEDSGS